MEELCLLIVGLVKVKYLKYNNIWICNKAIERKTCFVLLNASCIFDRKMFILSSFLICPNFPEQNVPNYFMLFFNQALQNVDLGATYNSGLHYLIL